MRAILVFLIFLNILYAEEVEVFGEGRDCKEALKNAKREAISRELGVFLKSESLVNSGNLIKDELLEKTAGFITNYEEINKRVQKNEYCKVKIRANVTMEVTQNFIKEMKRFNLFEDYNIANQKICVVTDEFEKTLNKSIITSLNSFLIDKGFKVFDCGELSKIALNIQKQNRDLKIEKTREYIPNQKATALIKFKLFEDTKQISNSSYKIDSKFKIDFIDISTGRIYATKEFESGSVANSKNCIDKIKDKNLKELALNGAVEILKQFIESKPQNEIEVLFSNIKLTEFFKIKRVLSKESIDYQVVSSQDKSYRVILKIKDKKPIDVIELITLSMQNPDDVNYLNEGNFYRITRLK